MDINQSQDFMGSGQRVNQQYQMNNQYQMPQQYNNSPYQMLMQQFSSQYQNPIYPQQLIQSYPLYQQNSQYQSQQPQQQSNMFYPSQHHLQYQQLLQKQQMQYWQYQQQQQQQQQLIQMQRLWQGQNKVQQQPSLEPQIEQQQQPLNQNYQEKQPESLSKQYLYQQSPQQLYQQYNQQYQPQVQSVKPQADVPQQKSIIDSLRPKTKENSLRPTTSQQKPEPIKEKPLVVQPPPEIIIQTLSKEEINFNLSKFVRKDKCHFCDKEAICYHCYQEYQETCCEEGFCFDCLTFKLKENILKVITLQKTWECPIKQQNCRCSKCNNVPDSDNSSLLSTQTFDSEEKYSRLIKNVNRIKQKYEKQKKVIKELFSQGYQTLDARSKRRQLNYQISKQKQQNKARRRKQLQFTGELIFRLKRKINNDDAKVIHNIIEYNFENLKQILCEQEI